MLNEYDYDEQTMRESIPAINVPLLVAPIIARHWTMASGPSMTAATSGPLVMKSTRSAKNGLPTCSA